MDRAMADPHGDPHFRGRLPAALGLLMATLCIAAVLAPRSASAAPVLMRTQALTPRLPVPGGFVMQASNGYTLLVLGVPPRERRPSSVEIIAFAKNSTAVYDVPATVTETSIQADLGDLGQISLTFQRTNHAAVGHCGKRKVSFDSGHYEGRFEFHGEEGYTSADVTSVPVDVDHLLEFFCGEVLISESSGGGPSRGASLDIRNPALGPDLSVTKSKPGAAAQITAGTSEYVNGISIERYIRLRMPSKDFTYDRRLRTATVRPPAPFSGSAHFDRTKKAGRRWSGNLTVDLPGESDVPLTGPSLRAQLSPWGSVVTHVVN